VANAFDVKGRIEKRTRSLLVIYKDKIIAEKYDTGFDKKQFRLVHDQKYHEVQCLEF
jgi:hypothetical protein